SGKFPSFQGMLIDPTTNAPLALPLHFEDGGLFAWRVADDKLHTILTLAADLAYTYDRGTVTVYGNVVDATHGQSTGEVLGNGDATRAFQSFTLSQSPLTYLSAPTPSGIASTLAVRVNELLRHELDDVGRAGPNDRIYVTREDDAQKTSVTFGDGKHGARLPTGTGNVKASYRYGLGEAGNVAAGQISQLATHPLGAQSVVNPLPASGGADPDRIDQARANAPLAVKALDRLVSVRDYADFTRTYAGIGKATASRISDGRRQLVHVTVAGAGDIAIDPSSDLYRNLLASLRAFGDPFQPVRVDPRRLRLLVMSAALGLQPDYAWEDVAPAVRAALLARFAFDARELGQSAFLSEAVRTAQDVAGVSYVDFSVFDSVGESVTATQLAGLGTTLTLREYVRAQGTSVDTLVPAGDTHRILPAELVFLTPDVPDTLILSEAGS
ncbi:MAG TPA: putative baseplate assembly protein, partial [Candidatus Elarobacter sp.]